MPKVLNESVSALRRLFYASKDFAWKDKTFVPCPEDSILRPLGADVQKAGLPHAPADSKSGEQKIVEAKSKAALAQSDATKAGSAASGRPKPGAVQPEIGEGGELVHGANSDGQEPEGKKAGAGRNAPLDGATDVLSDGADPDPEEDGVRDERRKLLEKQRDLARQCLEKESASQWAAKAAELRAEINRGNWHSVRDTDDPNTLTALALHFLDAMSKSPLFKSTLQVQILLEVLQYILNSNQPSEVEASPFDAADKMESADSPSFDDRDGSPAKNDSNGPAEGKESAHPVVADGTSAPKKAKVLLSSKEEEARKTKFNLLELHQVLYVLLSAHLLAVLYSPAIVDSDNKDNVTVRVSELVIHKTPM